MCLPTDTLWQTQAQSSARRLACHRQSDHALIAFPRHRTCRLGRSVTRQRSSACADCARSSPPERVRSRASLNSSVSRQRTTVPHSHDREQPAPSGRHFRVACYLHIVKVTEILWLLQQGGWELVATRGSHPQYKHGSKPGRVTVPGKPRDDLAPSTENSILKQAGLK